MQSTKTELFETLPIPRAVLKLSVPTVIASLVMIIYNLADTYFVGLLNDPIQTAGVTLAGPVMLAFNAITNLFGVGTSSKMSRALGVKDFETVRKASSFGFYMAFFSSVCFSLTCLFFRAPLLSILGADDVTGETTGGYLFWTVILGAVPAILNVILSNLVRAEGSASHASIGTMSGCILNMILDPIFILPFGLGLGARGAGFATFISNIVACIYFFVLLFVKRGNTYVCINPKKFSGKNKIARDICCVGIPASIQNLLNVTGMTVLNNFTASYDAAAVAAMGISHRTSLFPMYISMGISQGIMPLISYNFSAKNFNRMKETLVFTIKISMALIAFLSGGLWIFSGAVIKSFLNEPNVVAYGTKFLRAMTLSIPFLCFDFIGVAVFQACGMGGKSFVFAIFRKIILEIPALVVLNKLFPLYGLAYAPLCAEFVLAVAAFWVLVSMFRGFEKEAKNV